MEHARKMVLIPEESLSRLDVQKDNGFRFSNNTENDDDGKERAYAISTTKTIETTLSRLDAEMRDILRSDAYKDAREKWTAYLAVLQRYLHFTNSERSLHDTTLSEEKERKKTSEQYEHRSIKKPTGTGLNDSVIIKSIPRKFHNKAKLLLRRLRDTPAAHFSWDAEGVVSIRGKKLKDSNIVDLVNDAMRARKIPKPVGRKTFAQFLRSIKTPREFIGNEGLWGEAAANSTLQSPLLQTTQSVASREDPEEEEEDISDRYHSEFYSGSESNRSGSHIQSGSGYQSKSRRVSWARIKL